MKEQTRNDRGTHTTYIELAAAAVKVILKNFKDVSFSAGVITSGIGAKRQKISLLPKTGFVVMTVIMGYSKQEVRVFSIDPNELFRLLRAEYRGSVLVQKND